MSWNTSWGLYGNADTSISNFLGTTDGRPLSIGTSNRVAVRVSAGGDVSIGIPAGTRSPDYKLDVGGIVNADDVYKDGVPLVGSPWEPATGGIAYSGGNVGIGTPNPQRPLQVGGDVGGVGLAPSDVSPNAGFVRWGDNTGWKLHFGRSREGSGGSLNTGTRGVLVTLQDNGSVGIGTLAPNHRFHVVAPDAVGLFESSGGQAYLRISTNEGIDNRVEVTNRPGGRLSLWTAGGGDALNVLKNGNVGIGTTTPGSKLVVSGATTAISIDAGDISRNPNVAGALGFNRNVTDGRIFDAGFNAYQLSAYKGGLFFEVYSGTGAPVAPHALAISSNGNVGVGTSDPRAKLHVAGGLWNPSDTEGDFKIGDGTYRLKMGVATGGGGAGDVRIRAHGGTNRLMLGSGTLDTLFVNGDRVGIGTMTPGARLDVSGSGGATQCCAPIVPTLSLSEASNAANRQAWLQFHNGGEAEAYIRLAGGGPAGSGRDGQRRLEIGDSQGASTALQILANSNPVRFTAGWNGFPDAATNRSEISNDTEAYKTLMIVGNRSAGIPGPGLGRRVSVWDILDVNGMLNVTVNAAKPGGGSWAALSDSRLKKDVKPLADALDKVSRLRGVHFQWRKPEENGNLTGPQMGFVGQEVEEVFPEWVDTDASGYRRLTTRGFEALVVEAIKELKAQNEALQAQIRALVQP